MRDWRVWLKGLVAAAISSVANSASVLIADPTHFSPSLAGWKSLGSVILVSGAVGAIMYLKQSPIPKD